MKKQIPAFLSGMLTAALIGVLSVSALAASGQMTITVDPINIQVNGQTFQPKDVNGNDVPVFALNGTTYAPLRALAEAYGLEVGYNKELNMATVTTPGGAATPSDDVVPAPSDDGNVPGEDEAEYEFRNQDGEVVKYVDGSIDLVSFYVNGTKLSGSVPTSVLVIGVAYVNYEFFTDACGEGADFNSLVQERNPERLEYITFDDYHYVTIKTLNSLLETVLDYDYDNENKCMRINY